ncbi:MAG TPA: HNH endonuclease [Noviherbaspirillum sp.]|nr:HNH endonuclease [Noviherbaspirillum sp.]
MAKTTGHGNPNWTRDETILALDLYFDLNGKIPSGSDDRVQALSALLRRFPYHAEASRKDSFRNPDGVAFKLQNLRQVATGKGLGNVSEMDRRVWEEFGHLPSKTKTAADLIRAGVKATAEEPEFEDIEFTEGRIITALHGRRERNPNLRKRLLAQRKSKGALCCDMCGTAPLASNPDMQDAQFEAHHVVPLSVAGMTTTRLSDLALLCACCHRLLHRAIASQKRWVTIEEGRTICGITSISSH